MKLLYKCLILLIIFCANLPFSNAQKVENLNTANLEKCKKCVILAEQQEKRIVILNLDSKAIVWGWKLTLSDIKAEHYKWFSSISDAKLVYNGKYILSTASGGAVALIRIADKKTIFYAYAGGNTHAAEILPDGNIVSASSTGNFLTIFRVDTLNFPDRVYKKEIPLKFGHNVVWDHKNRKLWATANDCLKSFKYNFDCKSPDLTLLDSIPLPSNMAHDLFPVYGENALWLTTEKDIYKFNVKTNSIAKISGSQAHIKSISSGPKDYPILISKPKEQWWTDEIIGLSGESFFFAKGLKIYKARWALPNFFSYPTSNNLIICTDK